MQVYIQAQNTKTHIKPIEDRVGQAKDPQQRSIARQIYKERGDRCIEVDVKQGYTEGAVRAVHTESRAGAVGFVYTQTKERATRPATKLDAGICIGFSGNCTKVEGDTVVHDAEIHTEARGSRTEVSRDTVKFDAAIHTEPRKEPQRSERGGSRVRRRNPRQIQREPQRSVRRCSRVRRRNPHRTQRELQGKERGCSRV